MGMALRGSALALMVAATLAAGPSAARAAPPALTASVVGEPPNGGGVFRFPQAIGFTPGGGTVFVGDQFSGVVQAFDPDGTFRFAFGSRASRREPGRLGVVGGVAVDRSGHVYVLDAENDRVQIFDAADGVFRTAFGDASVFDLTSSTVPGPSGGISASGITVWQASPGASPVVFVADQGNDRVERFVLDPATLTPTGPPQLSSPSLGLSFPQGITTDPGGARLYVADDDNHRVVVLDPQTLELVAQVGSFGTGPGQFQNPYDVAVDARPPFQLYVADNLNNRVDVFDAATLASVGTFGGFGRTPGLFSIVRAVGAIADDPRGGVDVADTANNRIQALDASGGVLGAWGIAGRGAGYVTRPAGAAFDAAGGIAVADAFDHRISRFDADGTWNGVFGRVSTFNGFATEGSATGQFSRPEGVAFDAAGDAWVADTGNNRIVEIDPATGAVTFTSAAGAFSGPQGIARGTSGGIVVADTGHGTVAAVAPDGGMTVLRSGLSHPAAVAAGPALYAADDTHVLDVVSGAQVTPPAGSASWDHPAGLAVAPDGTLYVSERRPGTPNGARVVRGAPSNGGFSWDTIATEGVGSAQVIEPAGLALSADGATLLVADSGNNRVLRLDAPGSSQPITHAVRVAVAGITRGSVTSTPAGISCLTDCVQHFGAGRQVTLTATAVAGSIFSGWSGACAPFGTAGTCTLTSDGPLDAGATFAPTPPEPPTPTPVPTPTPTPVPTPTPRAPAKIRVLRAGVSDGVLDMLVEITSRAVTSGAKLSLSYRSSGHTTKFSVPIIAASAAAGGPRARAAEARVSIRRRLPASQREKNTGIVELNYAGSTRVQPDNVRLRAASGKSLLKRKTTKIQHGRLIVTGTINTRALGVVRIRLGYESPDAGTRFLYWKPRIARGTWRLDQALPARAAKGGQLAIQFTGYLPRSLRGEQTAKQVLP